MHELVRNDWLDTITSPPTRWAGRRFASAPCNGRLSARRRSAASRCSRSALARDYGTLGPAAIRLNYGMQRVRGGGNAARLVACLPALIGAWRHRAGGLLLSSSGSFPLDRAALHRPDLLGARRPRTINMVTIGDDLLREASSGFGPKIEALIVYNSNPVAVAPESAKVVQGFAREDLFTVVLEHFQTDTADYADYILPATTQLEHWDIHLSYGHTDVLLNRPAIAPVGQARTNADIFRALAARMGFADPCFSEDDETCAASRSATRCRSMNCWKRGLPRCRSLTRRLRREAFPRHPVAASSSARDWPRRAWTGCRTTCPTTSRPAATTAIRLR
jgi:hypothetical protein